MAWLSHFACSDFLLTVSWGCSRCYKMDGLALNLLESSDCCFFGVTDPLENLVKPMDTFLRKFAVCFVRNPLRSTNLGFRVCGNSSLGASLLTLLCVVLCLDSLALRFS